MDRLIIGLVGEAGVGKGEIARQLKENAFRYYSLSDSLRRIAADVGLSNDREILIKLGNSLRERFGSDILARGARRWVEADKITRAVIDSIRNPAEVSFLQRELGALVIGITMSPEKRFQLILERERPGDPQTWSEFLSVLRREQGIEEKSSGQQVQKCLESADVILLNEGTIAELRNHARELLQTRGVSLFT